MSLFDTGQFRSSVGNWRRPHDIRYELLGCIVQLHTGECLPYLDGRKSCQTTEKPNTGLSPRLSDPRQCRQQNFRGERSQVLTRHYRPRCKVGGLHSSFICIIPTQPRNTYTEFLVDYAGRVQDFQRINFKSFLTALSALLFETRS